MINATSRVLVLLRNGLFLALRCKKVMGLGTKPSDRIPRASAIVGNGEVR